MSAVAYTLVTPAKNEERYIEKTIQSVISQTVRPVKWVIVDDCSRDGTAAIAEMYASRYRWITVVRRGAGSSRDFASKARSFSAAYERLKDVAYDYIGNLDADVSLGKGYYARLFEFFRDDASLGIAGGRFFEIAENGRCHAVSNNSDSVRGAVQMFRRKCLVDVGGYPALPRGGIDSAAEIVARMKGWKVRTFPELSALHLRPTGGSNVSPFYASIQRGFQDHSLGYRGLFEVARCAARMGKRPYVVGGFGVLVGYFLSWFRADPPALPAEVVSFLRREQLAKLLHRREQPESAHRGFVES